MLRKIWCTWKKIGLFIANIIGTILSILIYSFVISPFGIIINLFTDYLKTKTQADTMWINRKSKDLTLEEMRRQF